MYRKMNFVKKGMAMVMAFALLIPAGRSICSRDNKVSAADYGVSNPRIAEDGTVTWDKIQFGSYKQSVEFEKQPIKWRILSVNEDGTDAFVMADRVLDCKSYNEMFGSVTWENCTLRNWLNNEFYNEAFSADEKTAIREVTVTNENNPSYNTEGGNQTTDKVYLLSIDEASNEEYGFDSEFSNGSKKRCVKATDYARMNGAYRSKSSDYVGNCYWWLRSPGTFGNASYVHYIGAGYSDGIYVSYGLVGVCPALHVNLSSAYVENAGEVNSDGKVTLSDNGYNNPRTSDGVTTWDCVYFGNYKQDGVVCEKEPVEWKVLSVKEDDAFIMADRALDSKPYNDIGTNKTDEDGDTYTDYLCTWETCTLRSWLNNEFYNEAFSTEEQAAVKEVTIANEDNPSYNTEGGKPTTDKVYLLSIDEASDEEYGFDSEFAIESKTRYVKATDYARKNGAHFSNSSGHVGNCYYWWLRSPGYSSYVYFASYVYYDGAGDYRGIDVSGDAVGVCPVLHINLSSNTWKSAGTVSAKLSNYDPTTTPTATPTNKPEEHSTSEPTTEPTIFPTGDATVEPTVTSTPINEPIVTPTAVPTNKPESTSSALSTNAPIVTATSTSAPTTATASSTPVQSVTQNSGSVTQSPTPSSSTSATPQQENTVTKKSIKLTSIKTKAKSKKITGKVSIKGVTIKIKIGKKSYKKLIKGNKFNIKIIKKLKSKDKVIIIASKKNYKSFKKTYIVK